MAYGLQADGSLKAVIPCLLQARNAKLNRIIAKTDNISAFLMIAGKTAGF